MGRECVSRTVKLIIHHRKIERRKIMKRSEINKALKELEAMCEKYHCYLPPFCHFTPEQWQTIGHEYDEVRDCMLGWDITDYGSGDFEKYGFSRSPSATATGPWLTSTPRSTLKSCCI